VDGYDTSMNIEVLNPEKGADSEYFLTCNPNLCQENNKLYNKDRNYIGCRALCACQNAKNDGFTCTNNEMIPYEKGNYFDQQVPNGYCGATDSQQTTVKFYESDPEGQKWCNSITAMSMNSQKERITYCQPFDDKKGTQSSGDGILKLILCDAGLEWAGQK
jgi:hypothetical protein